ncbi:hypothetical protein EDB92DRAFT_1798194, partial [Lactarius akahatsu]
IDGFHHSRFVHVACHGTPDRQTIRRWTRAVWRRAPDATRNRVLPSPRVAAADFAFLSACYTADVTEGSVIDDEGLHLAAAVQCCGFRSVVGTMWARVDEDGRDLAKHFYRALFSNSRREQRVPYNERSARALRFAVKKLRRKRWITPERWVDFVHYGA